jgi:GTPase SAR1 family protein
MAFINTKTKEVQVKLVFVGPGRGGKTTNLEYIFSRIRHRIESDMVSIKTQGDRTLFFDFLPFELGAIKGYNVKTQLYTVPGQVKYNATRKLVLKGVDGIVFVADSMVDRRENNISSLNNLRESEILRYRHRRPPHCFPIQQARLGNGGNSHSRR